MWIPNSNYIGLINEIIFTSIKKIASFSMS